MALKTTVKVSDITNLSDARYCAGMGVEILGFCFEDKQDKFVAPDLFTALSEWLSGVKYSADFTDYSAQQIEKTLKMYKPVELLQTASSEQATLLNKLELPIILQLEASNFGSLGALADEMKRSQHNIAYFNLENSEDVNYLTLEDALYLAEQYPVLLGFGVTPTNVLSLVDESAIQGIALKGSNEIKPGYKDYDALAEILEQLEVDETY